jgi:hypothetical protein
MRARIRLFIKPVGRDAARFGSFDYVTDAVEYPVGGPFAAHEDPKESRPKSDSVATAIRERITAPWHGTAGELLTKLTRDKPAEGLAVHPQGMSGRLTRIAPTLRALGWTIKQEQRTSTARPWTPSHLLGLPWRVAFALPDDGWILRKALVWHQPHAMPESVRKRMNYQYEFAFLLVKSRCYWFDLDPLRIPHATVGPARGCRAPGGGIGPRCPPAGGEVRGSGRTGSLGPAIGVEVC